MSGYIGEPEKMQPTWQPTSEAQFSHKESFVARKLHNREVSDPTSRKKIVERLADLAANYNSVEAAANLALFMELDLNDYILREGVINGIREVPGAQNRLDALKYQAIKCDEQGDVLGFTALAAIVGCYPPEKIYENQ